MKVFISALFINIHRISEHLYFRIKLRRHLQSVTTWKDEAGVPINMTGVEARMKIMTRDGPLMKHVRALADALTGQTTLLFN